MRQANTSMKNNEFYVDLTADTGKTPVPDTK